jgi:hypothetical protein
MWTWKEFWLSNYVCVYLSEPTCFGFAFELTTKGFDLFIGYFGISAKW